MISIITPVYKVEQYLTKCIQSVLAQTFTDYELILIDDGSPDNSGAICDSFAARDSRIRVIHTENQGAAKARNRGLDEAVGEFIVFLDSDDYLHPFFLETLIHNIDNADLCCVGVVSVKSPPEEFDTKIDFQCVSIREVNGKQSFHEIFDGAVLTSPCNKLFRREVIEERHLRFDPITYWCEDAQFVAEYCSYIKNTIIVETSLYYYVIHDGSNVHSPFSEKKMGFLHGYEKIALIAQAMDEAGIVDITVCIHAQHLLYQLYREKQLKSSHAKRLKKEIKSRRSSLISYKGLAKQRLLCLCMSFSVRLGCLLLRVYKHN